MSKKKNTRIIHEYGRYGKGYCPKCLSPVSFLYTFEIEGETNIIAGEVYHQKLQEENTRNFPCILCGTTLTDIEFNSETLHDIFMKDTKKGVKAVKRDRVY